MIVYKDITFCINPNCTCDPSHRLTEEVKEKAKRMGLPIAMGDLCQEVADDNLERKTRRSEQ